MKERTPSWTDRICYHKQFDTKMKIIEYNSMEVYISDHHPVYLVCDIDYN